MCALAIRDTATRAVATSARPLCTYRCASKAAIPEPNIARHERRRWRRLYPGNNTIVPIVADASMKRISVRSESAIRNEKLPKAIKAGPATQWTKHKGHDHSGAIAESVRYRFLHVVQKTNPNRATTVRGCRKCVPLNVD